MKICYYTCLSLVLFSLSACGFLGNSLPGLWFYTYSGGAATEKENLLSPASFIELRQDGTYTRDFGRFEYGTWIRKDQQLCLTNQQHTTSVLQLHGVNSNEMQLDLAKDLSSYFEGQPVPSAQAAEDPFSVNNNRWRIPAIHKESDEEIRRRLYNHCQFWVIYFSWAQKKELATVDVRSTPTAIKIYGNGFTLKPFADLPAEWKSYFFDEEDCRKANDVIEDIFRHKTIAWAQTDNKYKMFLSAFQQMGQFLR